MWYDSYTALLLGCLALMFGFMVVASLMISSRESYRKRCCSNGLHKWRLVARTRDLDRYACRHCTAVRRVDRAGRYDFVSPVSSPIPPDWMSGI